MVEKKRYESPTASVIFHVEDVITMSGGTMTPVESGLECSFDGYVKGWW